MALVTPASRASVCLPASAPRASAAASAPGFGPRLRLGWLRLLLLGLRRLAEDVLFAGARRVLGVDVRRRGERQRARHQPPEHPAHRDLLSSQALVNMFGSSGRRSTVLMSTSVWLAFSTSSKMRISCGIPDVRLARLAEDLLPLRVIRRAQQPARQGELLALEDVVGVLVDPQLDHRERQVDARLALQVHARWRCRRPASPRPRTRGRTPGPAGTRRSPTGGCWCRRCARARCAAPTCPRWGRRTTGSCRCAGSPGPATPWAW